MSASEVSDIAKAYKSVGISVYNANGEFQDVDKTLSQLSEKWADLSDAQRSYIAEKSAGVRQKNAFLILMEEYEAAMKLAEEAKNSEGFSDEVQAKYAESLTAKLNTLKSTGQEFWNNLLGGGEAKQVVDLFTDLLSIVNKIVDKFGAMPTLATLFGGSMLTKGGGRVKMFTLVTMPPKSLTVTCTN